MAHNNNVKQLNLSLQKTNRKGEFFRSRRRFVFFITKKQCFHLNKNKAFDFYIIKKQLTI